MTKFSDLAYFFTNEDTVCDVSSHKEFESHKRSVLDISVKFTEFMKRFSAYLSNEKRYQSERVPQPEKILITFVVWRYFNGMMLLTDTWITLNHPTRISHGLLHTFQVFVQADGKVGSGTVGK